MLINVCLCLLYGGKKREEQQRFKKKMLNFVHYFICLKTYIIYLHLRENSHISILITTAFNTYPHCFIK